MNIKAIVTLSLLALSTSACAPKEKQHELFLQVDEPFQAYVSAFEQASSEEANSLVIDDLIVSFGTTPSLNETGICEFAENETPRITINQRIWNTLNDYDRQEVMFHELGHCVLRRIHRNGEIRAYNNSMNIPQSVMYPYRISGSVYRDNIAHYHDELFSRGNEF